MLDQGQPWSLMVPPAGFASMTHLPPHISAKRPMEGEATRGVSVLHEASGVVAVLKPAGLATQAPPGIDSMEQRMRVWLAGRGGGYLGVPHRLDRPVSGVLLFAVTPRAARQLSRQFERRQVVKRYAAVLEPRSSRPLPASGDWEEWRDLIAKVPDEPRARLVPPEEHCEKAREAITRVRLVAARVADIGVDPPAIEVEFEPLTGRMHQLRLQASSRGMPVVGDAAYGATSPFREATCGLTVPPIALHASRIEYLDPDTKSPVVVESPPPW